MVDAIKRVKNFVQLVAVVHARQEEMVFAVMALVQVELDVGISVKRTGAMVMVSFNVETDQITKMEKVSSSEDLNSCA